MRRSALGGLTEDEDENPQDPDVRRARLKTLCLHSEDPRALFSVQSLFFDDDAASMIDADQKALAYLCRYGRVDLEYWEHEPVTRVAQWIRLIGELLTAESGKPSTAAAPDAREAPDEKLLGRAFENDYS